MARLDLSTLRRTFTVQGHDVVTSLIAPALIAAEVIEALTGTRR